jgi:hypothetical protein
MGERAPRNALLQWDLEVQASGHSETFTTGKRAARAWLHARGLLTAAFLPWHVEITFDVHDAPATVHFDERSDTRFRLEIYSEEWGVFFCHRGRASWIRVTDIPFVHGRDDFHLLHAVPALNDIASLLRAIEQEHAIAFKREHALIRTNLPAAEPVVRAWIRTL